jgi:hypothetical protein
MPFVLGATHTGSGVRDPVATTLAEAGMEIANSVDIDPNGRHWVAAPGKLFVHSPSLALRKVLTLPSTLLVQADEVIE